MFRHFKRKTFFYQKTNDYFTTFTTFMLDSDIRIIKK